MDQPMRGEMRMDNGNPTVWVCLDDVLRWLEELPGETTSVEAGAAALEIRQMLIDFVSSAELKPRDS